MSRIIFRPETLFIVLFFTISCQPPLGYDDYPSGHYSPQAIEYFKEIAFGAEFGLGSNIEVIIKWHAVNVHVQLHGAYTQDDGHIVENTLQDISHLTGIRFHLVNHGGHINIHLVDRSQFKSIIPSYVEGNDAYFVLDGVQNHVITRATIVIDKNITGQQRRHLLLEELTQSLGLMRDSARYPDSIFQKDANYMPTQLSQIDREVIRLLYDNRVQPGMNKVQFAQAINTSSDMYASR